MKIVCISDIHGQHKNMSHKMPEGDILCVAGDISNVGRREQIESFGAWLKKLPYEKKIVCAGNHDWAFANNKKEKASNWLKQNDESIVYLQDEGYIYNGIKFYASPWQPEFCNWAFNLPRGKALKEKWDMIPNDTDVLITHGPPAGIMDKDPYGTSVGDIDLLYTVNEIKPKMHIFGHIHDGYGINKFMDTVFINASICNEIYLPVNKPIVWEI
jgi:Icc-related predicted phosphoesterase